MSLLEKHRNAHPAIKLLALLWDLRWRYALALIVVGAALAFAFR